jgi:hypothetical protein
MKMLNDAGLVADKAARELHGLEVGIDGLLVCEWAWIKEDPRHCSDHDYPNDLDAEGLPAIDGDDLAS